MKQSKTAYSYSSRLELLDWDFKKESARSFLHDICWYPCRFIPVIPAQLIDTLSSPGDTVLDPFCGVGTTLIESLRLNRNAICSDLNPIAVFISKTKARVFSGQDIDLSKMKTVLGAITECVDKSEIPLLSSSHGESRLGKIELEEIPNYEELSQWFHEDTLKILGGIKKEIDSIEHELTSDVLKVIFLGILMGSTGHTGGKPYTYYADNVKPKDGLAFKNSFKLYSKKLMQFISEYEEEGPLSNNSRTWAVRKLDVRELATEITNPVDLIVTSPPYLDVADYTKGFRLAHLWFGDDEDEIKQSTMQEIGARWKRKKKGSHAQYLDDMTRSLCAMNAVLKPGGHMALVIGESRKYLDTVISELEEYLVDVAGLKVVLSKVREISNKSFKHPSGGVDMEKIIVLKK
ncbi:MAG TPA: DNA methyltransferase [Mariprofundaceae bacterium]|nr:DNA methyltransferase [Mariprofundaceae bacterium]